MSDTYNIEVNDFERRALIGVLAEKRNQCLAENAPTEDVNTLIEKTLDAKQKKQKKEKKERDRDER